MDDGQRKHSGSYYTPEAVVRSLVAWAAHDCSDRLLDPSCGDGRFLAAHANSVGVEQDPEAAAIVHSKSPGSLIHQGDFFGWASQTHERFECAAGNPPFIRYQSFTGQVREAAQQICTRNGATFSSLSSSWAPFIVATATLLKRGGRMAFVVPAEIGHAPYAIPVLEYLAAHFADVQVVAVQRKLFPQLSEDCWLLRADGFGGLTDSFLLTPLTQFGFMRKPPSVGVRISVTAWRKWNCRLRPFLMSSDVRELYRSVADDPRTSRLSDLAKVGIGYVTGDNDFFHLRPSQAGQTGIPRALLAPTIRNGRSLAGNEVTMADVEEWWRRDEQKFLLRLSPSVPLPQSVLKYLDSDAGKRARAAYKCRNRNPWFAVSDVVVPDAFMSYMSSDGPALVANRAGCVGTNSVHVLELRDSVRLSQLQSVWSSPLTKLSCELEGHPLGGGMLKLEPREAGRILVSRKCRSGEVRRLVLDGITAMRQWRHHG